MKASVLFSLFIFIFLSHSNSYSLPLNGTYTIGSGGNYLTIDSAVNDAQAQGISSSVIFEILPGIYNENVSVIEIPGSSLTKTLTLKSATNNYNEVTVNSLKVIGSNIIIKYLSVNSDVEISGLGRNAINNVDFSNNDLRNNSMAVFADWFFNATDINITGNVNAANMIFYGEFWISLGKVDSVQIKNNIINGNLNFYLCYNFIIENNTISGNLIFQNPCNNFDIRKNTINGDLINDANTFKTAKNKITGKVITSGDLINNFIAGKLYYNGGINHVLNNTIFGGTIDTPSVTIGHYLNSNYFYNNIVINPAGGTTIIFDSLITDHNDYFNGGNNNLINYKGTNYNNVQDFYNATGLDQHSVSQPVTFVSQTDLHLTGSSIGDQQLIGMPDTLVTDDIDGDLRNPAYPYKGADESVDFPLPVKLAFFTSVVTNSNVNLNWITASEINNKGFDIERTKVNSVVSNEWSEIGFVPGKGTSPVTNLYEYTDKGINPGKYNYRLKQIDFNGNFNYFELSEEVIVGTPEQFTLDQNYPNPFNPFTVISYQLASNQYVLLKIYDVRGKEVMTLVNEYKEAGSYKVIFSTGGGNNFPSGAYFYQINTGNFKITKKMILMK